MQSSRPRNLGRVARSVDVVALLARGAEAVGTEAESRWFDELDDHRRTVDAYVESTLAGDDGAAAAHLGALLWPYWTRRATDGAEWLERVLVAVERTAPPPSEDFALLLYGAGLAAFRHGDNPRSRTLSQQSLDVATDAMSPIAQVRAHVGLSRAAFRDHDWNAGIEHARTAGRIAADCGDEPGALVALHMEAEITRAAGDYAATVPLYERLLSGDRAAGDVRAEAMELYNLGSVLLQVGELDRAGSCLRESLRLADEHADHEQFAYTTLGLAGLAARRAEPAVAGRLLGAVEAYFDAAGVVLDPAEQIELDSHRAAGRSADVEAFEAGFAQGRALSVQEAAASYRDT